MLNGAPVRVAHVAASGFDIQVSDKPPARWSRSNAISGARPLATPFLITAIPLASKPASFSYGGTGRSDAFCYLIDRDAPLSGSPGCSRMNISTAGMRASPAASPKRPSR